MRTQEAIPINRRQHEQCASKRMSLFGTARTGSRQQDSSMNRNDQQVRDHFRELPRICETVLTCAAPGGIKAGMSVRSPVLRPCPPRDAIVSRAGTDPLTPQWCTRRRTSLSPAGRLVRRHRHSVRRAGSRGRPGDQSRLCTWSDWAACRLGLATWMCGPWRITSSQARPAPFDRQTSPQFGRSSRSNPLRTQAQTRRGRSQLRELVQRQLRPSGSRCRPSGVCQHRHRRRHLQQSCAKCSTASLSVTIEEPAA